MQPTRNRGRARGRTGVIRDVFLPRVEQGVVVSRVQGGVWTPMSAAETYSDGHRVTFQRVGDHWRSPETATAQIDPAAPGPPVLPSSATPRVPAIAPAVGPRNRAAVCAGAVHQNPVLRRRLKRRAHLRWWTSATCDRGGRSIRQTSDSSSIPRTLAGGLAVFAETLMNVNDLHSAFHPGHCRTAGL